MGYQVSPLTSLPIGYLQRGIVGKSVKQFTPLNIEATSNISATTLPKGFLYILVPTVKCWVKLSTDSSAATVGGDIPIGAFLPWAETVLEDDVKIAVIKHTDEDDGVLTVLRKEIDA